MTYMKKLPPGLCKDVHYKFETMDSFNNFLDATEQSEEDKGFWYDNFDIYEHSFVIQKDIRMLRLLFGSMSEEAIYYYHNKKVDFNEVM